MPIPKATNINRMPLRPKIFTKNEIVAMMPLVSRIVDDIIKLYPTVEQSLIAADDEKDNKFIKGEVPFVAVKEQIAKDHLDQLQELVDELEKLGGSIKNLQRGVVDFYGELNGQIISFCWCATENPGTHVNMILNYYHDSKEPCSKRRSIDGSPTPFNPFIL